MLEVWKSSNLLCSVMTQNRNIIKYPICDTNKSIKNVLYTSIYGLAYIDIQQRDNAVRWTTATNQRHLSKTPCIVGEYQIHFMNDGSLSVVRGEVHQLPPALPKVTSSWAGQEKYPLSLHKKFCIWLNSLLITLIFLSQHTVQHFPLCFS